jgi:hypothetical protein
MQARHKLVSLIFLLALGTIASAQDLQLSFKLGAGPILGDPAGHRYKSGVHLATELSLGLGKGQAFVGGQYRVFRSRSYEATQFGTGYALNASGAVVTGRITPYKLGPDGLPSASGLYDSVDVRRDNLEGFSLYGGYRVPVWVEGLSAHAGVNLSFLRSQQDVTGGIKVLVDRNVTTPVILGQESFYTQFQKSTMCPGAFAGLRYDATKVFFVEANLSGIGFKEINYLPFSYTGQPAATEMRSRFKLMLEFSVGINF